MGRDQNRTRKLRRRKPGTSARNDSPSMRDFALDRAFERVDRLNRAHPPAAANAQPPRVAVALAHAHDHAVTVSAGLHATTSTAASPPSNKRTGGSVAKRSHARSIVAGRTVLGWQ